MGRPFLFPSFGLAWANLDAERVGHGGVVSNGTPATVRERVAAEEMPATNGHMGPRPATNGAVAPAPKPTAAVRIPHVTKPFGRTAVFADVNLSVAKG